LLLRLDDAVSAAVQALKARGFESPYLKTFVVARINPLRFAKGDVGPFDDVIGKMIDKAEAFDAAKIEADQLASASGPPDE
jgi:ParB family chromosome partitioning protein